MRFQDQVVKSTYRALDDICRAALAVPKDKADWVPMGSARSVLDQMQEVADSGRWFQQIVKEGVAPDFDRHAFRESLRLRKTWDTVEKCVEVAREQTGALCQAISELPDERLEHEMKLPFGGGMIMTMADVCAMHSWNMIYHLGQINYVQLMLGDKEMH